MPVMDYQLIYDLANQEPMIRDVSISDSFTHLDQTYDYFSGQKSAANEYSRFYNFFNLVKVDENDPASNEEIQLRAYMATVLLGGGERKSACKVLQRLVNEGYKTQTKPIHDAFSTITLPIKAANLNLTLWRKWINGPNTKSALKRIASASDIVNKFGPIHGYTVAVPSVKITQKNAEDDTLYLHQGIQDSTIIAFVFRGPKNELQRGLLTRDDLIPYDDVMTAITTQKPLSLEQEIRVFAAIKMQHKHLCREVRFEEVRSLQGKLTYERFDEAPDLAVLFHEFNQPESTFNRCIALLGQQKSSDTLPNITVDGREVGHEGYHLVKLPINDPHAFILGHGLITNCCQFIGGVSEQCVIDGWTLPSNGFYVLLKSKKDAGDAPLNALRINYQAYDIVGQGYAWRSLMSNLVFDSWENLRPQRDDGIAVAMLTSFAQKAVVEPEHSICRVTIGLGGKTPRSLAAKSLSVVETIAHGYDYGDAKKQSELSSKDVMAWKSQVSDILAKFAELSNDEKKILVDQAPMAASYINMLTHYLRPLHPWIKKVFDSRDAHDQLDILSALTILHGNFSDEIQRNTIQHMDSKTNLPNGYVNAVLKYAENCSLALELFSISKDVNLLMNDAAQGEWKNLMEYPNLPNLIRAIRILHEADLLSGEAGKLNLTPVLESDYPHSVASKLVGLNEGGLLNNDAVGQANREAALAHDEPWSAIIVLEALNRAGLLSNDAAGRANRVAALAYKKPMDVIAAFEDLNNAGLLSDDEAGEANRTAVMQHQKPNGVAHALEHLYQKGLLTNDAAGQVNRALVLQHHDPKMAAYALAILNEAGILLYGVAGEANRAAVLRHDNPCEAASALAILSKAGLLSDGAVGQVNRAAVIGYNDPRARADALAVLNEAGLLGDDAAGEANRSAVLGYVFSAEAARALAVLNKGLLSNDAAGQANRIAVLVPAWQDPREVAYALNVLSEAGLLSNDAVGQAHRAAVLDHQSPRKAANALAILNNASLLIGDAAGQATQIAVLTHNHPDLAAEGLAALNKAGLLSDDAAGQANRAALLENKEPWVARDALEQLYRAGLWGNDAVGRESRSALLKNQAPSALIDALVVLKNAGINVEQIFNQESKASQNKTTDFRSVVQGVRDNQDDNPSIISQKL